MINPHKIYWKPYFKIHCRATELNEEARRVRSPRFLQPDSLVRPYIKEEAEGNKILMVKILLL